jgi:hypothetical protein
MKRITNISTDEWMDQYQPIPIPAGAPSAGWVVGEDGEGAKSYLHDWTDDLCLAALEAADQKQVWTWIDGDDGNQYIVSGARMVNRIGYFICAVPWTEFVEVQEDLNGEGW